MTHAERKRRFVKRAGARYHEYLCSLFAVDIEIPYCTPPSMPQVSFSPSKEVAAWLKAGAKAHKRSVSAFVQLTLDSSRLLEEAHRDRVHAMPLLNLRSVSVPAKDKRKDHRR